ncbi:type IX secretion system sortase PorU [Duncaniella muris]|uniref:type IX secretion system sortase PorU n=1 Tax=Duncaniella muris TaxID=2094150 RepID=UPI0025A9E6C1|nr:type IX secretion system sortase PorU [Duncaniella muris]
MPSNSKPLSLITASLLALSAQASHAADYAPSSVLASGQWVKVHVDSTSVYRIDYPTLRSWGFDEPEKVRVFGYGSVEQAHPLDTAPDDLPPVTVWHTADAMYFYGEGDERTVPSTSSSIINYRNHYSRGSNYFLTASLPGITIGDTLCTAQTTPVETHLSIDLRHPEEVNFHSAGVFFFSQDLTTLRNGYTFTFSAPDFAGYANLAYRYAYLHSENTAQNIAVTFSGPVTHSAFTPATHKNNTIDNRLYSLSTLKKIPVTAASELPFSVNFSIPAGKQFDRLALAEVYWMYQRKNNFRGPAMFMNFLPSTTPLGINLSGLSDDVEIWDVSDPRAIKRLGHDPLSDGRTLVTLPARSTTEKKLCLFTPGSDIPKPAFAGSVSARNLHAMPATDYLIVTTTAFQPEAERLAEAHRLMQGLDVTVVTQNDIFDEFSSGSPHPNAVRKFVRMLRERPAKPLRYLLLMGAATYDPRHNVSDDGIDYLTGYEVERPDHAASMATDHATDLYFGFMTDRIAENLSSTFIETSVSIGRAPVLTAAEARIFVDKCIAYLQEPRLAGRPDLAVLVACEGDKDAHLKGSEKLRAILMRNIPSVTCPRIYNALYPFDKKIERKPTFAPMASQVARGPFLLNYTGHSGAYEIGSVMSISHIDRLTFTSMPVTFFASCETTPVDAPFRGIGTKLFLHPSGPIALVGTGRDVYLNNNQTLNEEFARQISLPDGPERLGDVWRTTINLSGKNSSVQRTNNFCYNFLGDPALPVRRPDRRAAVSFSSETGDAESTLDAPSLSPLMLNGRITLADGSTDTAFDGNITLSLYDAPLTTMRYAHASGDSIKPMTLDEKLLYETSAEVKNGLWSATITPPLSSREGRNRLTMLAYSDDGHIACGIDSTLTVRQPLTPIPTDTTGPQISLYLDSPDFINGSETGPSPVLYASIRDDESGIATGSANIGDLPTAVLDSSTRLADIGPAMRFGTDGSAEVAYTLRNLPAGRHTLTLSARDVAGNTSRETLTFTVVDTMFSAILSTDSTICRKSVELDLAGHPTSRLTSRLIIRNMEGATVFTLDNASFPFAWDFRDSSGAALPDGTYRASVLITDGLRFGSSNEAGFTLIRPRY